MKAPKELKIWISRMRKKYARKNGVFSGYLFEGWEVYQAKNKNEYKRHQQKEL
jgi:hypothetical protein